MESCAIGAEGARAIAASPHLASLRSLRWHDMPSGDALAAAVAVGTLTALEELSLSSSGVTAAGAIALGGATGLPKLRVLRLANNDISAEGAAGLVRGHLRDLERLETSAPRYEYLSTGEVKG